MRKLVKLCFKGVILAGVGLASTVASAAEFKIDRFFVVGDSLSDGGAYSQLAMVNIGPGAPNIFYKFTENNPDGSSNTWAGFLGERFGIDMGPDVVNGVPAVGLTDIDVNGANGGTGVIYAEGGARVSNPDGISNNPLLGVTTRPVSVQVDRLLADVGGKFRDNDLVAVWAGGNDGFTQSQRIAAGDITPTQAAVEMSIAAMHMEEQVQRLKDAGAKNVLVFAIPVNEVNPSPYTPLFQVYNDTLKSSLTGKGVLIIDYQRLIEATDADPARFGFTSPNAVSQPSCTTPSSLYCITGVTTLNDGSHTRSDSVHLSQQSNKNFADFVFATLRAASQQATMMDASLSSIRMHGVSFSNRLGLDAFEKTHEDGRKALRKVGDIEAYGSIQGGYLDQDAGQIDPGSSQKSQTIRIGADILAAKNVVAGVSFSVDHNQTDYDDNAGGFDSRTFTASFYGNVAVTKNIYINAAVGAGLLDIHDINRSFNIGPSQESYDGETEGLYKMATIGAGYVHSMGSWRFTPSVSFTYETIKIDAYTESYGVASLSYGDNEMDSARLSAGLAVSYISPEKLGWSATLKGTIEHEFLDDWRTINLGMDENTIGQLYLPRPDGTYGYISAEISKKFTENTSFGINASTIVGQDGVSGVTGGISIKSKF